MILPVILTAEDFSKYYKADFWSQMAETICFRHKISFNRLQRSAFGESIVFLVDTKFVIKIYIPIKNGLRREKSALEFAKTCFKLPEIIASGQIENFDYLVMTQIAGESITRDIWLNLEKSEQIQILSELARGLTELHASETAQIDFDWHKFIESQAENCVGRQRLCGVNSQILESLPVFLEANLKLLPANFKQVFLHGDVHFGNLRFKEINGRWQISGLFDFADSLRGFHEYDFLAIGVLMIQGQGDLQREFFRAFGYADSEIDETLRRRLMLLTCFYEWSDLRRYAVRLRPEAVNYSLEKLEKAIWNFV
ncbi:MAG: aminoglycoside phosphotransferase family protein [Pyrinomonadaceae bacterium]|nr:aminoglycoside phosphotransferase family protein [Pyrinomonadaceae bacterium]